MRKEDRRTETISETAHGSISKSVYDIIDHKAELLKKRGIGEDDIGNAENVMKLVHKTLGK